MGINSKRENQSRRSVIMARVKSKDTKPEMRVRRAAHALGFRYRLHKADLPGKPDLVFAKRRKIIFVHGCFWHGHDCRAGRNRPATNLSYWNEKLLRNAERDCRNLRALLKAGWESLVIWECETRDEERLRKKLRRFLIHGNSLYATEKK